MLKHRKIPIRTQPVLSCHTRCDQRQALGQLRFGSQRAIDLAGERIQRHVRVTVPVTRQAMVEKHIEHDACVPTPLGREASNRCLDQRVIVSEGINTPMQANGGFKLRRKTPRQWTFDEVAIQAAEQLRGPMPA
ncbi:hypothetical protein PSA5_22915 [Pseudomonas syringae pv. actinidiae]|nr:hypothetical protein PSA5_22915 [Pseudomonas syringae pv. actinidiae]